jgi:pyridoxine kinase
MLAPILSIQSHVVYGHVGNAAAIFPLQRLGREVWPLMTVQFSSHTGYPGWRGRAFDAATIDECVEGLDAIGVLPRCAGLLTGYLGKPEIGEATLGALARIRAVNPDAVYACDPVIGDTHRGSYVAPGVAEFFRDRALPLATLLTPNAFELQALAGLEAADRAGALAAIGSVRARGPEVVVAKSLSLSDTPDDALDMIAVDAGGAWRVRTPRLPIALSGTGDLFAALFLHHWLANRSVPDALSRTASSVFGIVAATQAARALELQIVAAQEELVHPSRVFLAQAA